MDINEFFRVNVKNASKKTPIVLYNNRKKYKEDKEKKKLRLIESERRREIDRKNRKEEQNKENIENQINSIRNLKEELVQLQKKINHDKLDFEIIMKKKNR